MKVGKYRTQAGGVATGVLVDLDGVERILDLSHAATKLIGPDEAVGSLDSLIAGGRGLLERAYDLVGRSKREGEDDWFSDPETVSWMIPTSSSICLCAGRNFGRHKAEAIALWAARGSHSDQKDIPTGFAKLRSSLVPDGASVVRPPDLQTLDYEVEVAAVIGRRIERISETDARDAVFGYTVFNDLSAREWQFREMENHMILVGKNFPGAGPIGPWILTAESVSDPGNFELELRVNGERRQHSDCSDMIFGFPQLIAFWSRLILGPGDVIASGTPEGVAHSHKPDPKEWYLKPGDLVEAEVRQIGVLTTRIV